MKYLLQARNFWMLLNVYFANSKFIVETFLKEYIFLISVMINLQYNQSLMNFLILLVL